MVLQGMQQHSRRITRFVTVQLIALVGWIIVQSTFTLSPLGRAIGFPLIMVVESIWWLATLVIMYVMFKRVYNNFLQAVLDLENANKNLRHSTNVAFSSLRNQNEQQGGSAATN